jgi:subtilisin family serine protease
MPRYALGTVTPASGSQVTPYGISMVQADQVSDAMAGDRTVCIVDSGIDGTHEDHQGNRLTGVNLTTSGDWNTDEAHHGTHVAGTIAAVDNDIGVIGVMPHTNINLFIAKVFDASGQAASSTIAKAMLECRTLGHANVVSMSLGGSGASKLEQAVVTFLAKTNVLLIAAAGNNGDGSVSYPAGFAEVVSVAAVDSNMAHASFSQFNSDVELSAPGVHVLSTVPMGTGIDSSLTVGGTPFDSLPMTGAPLGTATAPLYDYGTGEVSDPGVAGKVCVIQRGNISFAQKVVQCQTDGGVGAIIYNNTTGDLNGTLGTTVTNIPSIGITQADGATLLTMVGTSATLALTASNYAYFDGTSMATPHVSAVAALVWSHHPHCSAAKIRASLDNSALDLGDPGRDDYFGYGLVQAKAADDRINSLGCGN